MKKRRNYKVTPTTLRSVVQNKVRNLCEMTVEERKKIRKTTSQNT